MKRLAMAGMVVAAGLAMLPAQAGAGVQVGVVIGSGDRGYRDDWRGGGPAFRHGYDRGWRDGSEEGSHDGRRNRDPRFWREDDFRDADNGYKHWMGPRFEYSQGYREGYRMGYRRAYASRRPAWRGNWGRYGYDDRYGRGGRYDDRYGRGGYDDRYGSGDRRYEEQRRENDERAREQQREEWEREQGRRPPEHR